MGKHHKPSTTGKNIAKAALVLTALPAGTALVGAGTASAAEPTGILDEIARCESGGNPNAQNPSSTASGTYQFLDSTWQSVTGLSGSASDYSPAQQRAAAEKLLAQQGTSPWNASKSCWGGASGASQPASERHSAPKAQKKVERKAEVAKPKSSDKDCSDFRYRQDAQDYFDAKGYSAKNDPEGLDNVSSVGDGNACESLPSRPVAKKAAPKPIQKVAPKVSVQHVAPKPAVPAGAHFTPGGDGEYVVKTGDTLSHLARQHNTSVAKLMELNKDIVEMPGWIFVGEKLHLR